MKIAVVGAGISGLASAWMLSGAHRVTLFEAADYLGGHANTVDVELDGELAAVDTGFLVYNEQTYPNFSGLLAGLGVETVPSDMSFSVRVEAEDLEWCGSSLGTVFAQGRNLGRARFWRMLQDTLRFNAASSRHITETAASGETLGDLLARGGYSDAFRDWYLMPMAAAIWSTPTRDMLDCSAYAFLSFCRNHGLLQLAGRPQWRTIAGGSRQYVQRLAAGVDNVRLRCPVLAVRRRPEAVDVVTTAGVETFDALVLACHSDQAGRLLVDASPAERSVLGAFRYQPNTAVLHTDDSFLPQRRRAWAAWNYLSAGAAPDARPVAVTYLLNELQPLPFSRPLMVTLNPYREPNPQHVLARFHYMHPLLDAAAYRAQARIGDLQNQRRTWFCGAWTGHGFHEDGLRSALCVAEALGGRRPVGVAA